MKRVDRWAALAILVLSTFPSALLAQDKAAKLPNIIFVLADDLGYGDLGCYGQKIIKTPRLDRMASEGLRFTQFYAGSTVCAPSRSVLMTGQHLGHTRVRGNAGAKMLHQSLTPEDVTVAAVLKKAGYATALIGKWGLGELDHPGHPLKQGFDYFYGYLNQVHAHNYYPEFLWRDRDKVALGNEVKLAEAGAYGGFRGGVATKRVDYAQDLLMKEALAWIRQQRQRPFFLYLALTLPHANNEARRMVGDGTEVPDYGIYAKENWPNPDKGQAAMITLLDRDVGRLLDLLGELGIADRTLVIFSSDNGPHNEAGHNLQRFRPAGIFRGIKRDLNEGGLRVPFVAWWPGTIRGGVSDHVGYFGDFLATAAELAGIDPPANVDSISFLPTLRGQGQQQKQPRYLYWEFYERGGAQAVRLGRWKGLCQGFGGDIELYDLQTDPAEEHNLAAKNPDVVTAIRAAMREAHRPSPLWEIPKSKSRKS